MKNCSSNSVSRILVLFILLQICLHTVCNGLTTKFKGKTYHLLQGQGSNSPSDAENKFNALMEQCKEVQFIPNTSWLVYVPKTRSHLKDENKNQVNPEFLHYLAHHVKKSGGEEGSDYRILCQDAVAAGFPMVEGELEKRLHTEWADVLEKFHEPNYFHSFMEYYRKINSGVESVTSEHPLHDPEGKPSRQFKRELETEGKQLLAGADKSKLRRIYSDGILAGYRVHMKDLKKQLRF